MGPPRQSTVRRTLGTPQPCRADRWDGNTPGCRAILTWAKNGGWAVLFESKPRRRGFATPCWTVDPRRPLVLDAVGPGSIVDFGWGRAAAYHTNGSCCLEARRTEIRFVAFPLIPAPRTRGGGDSLLDTHNPRPDSGYDGPSGEESKPVLLSPAYRPVTQYVRATYPSRQLAVLSTPPTLEVTVTEERCPRTSNRGGRTPAPATLTSLPSATNLFHHRAAGRWKSQGPQRINQIVEYNRTYNLTDPPIPVLPGPVLAGSWFPSAPAARKRVRSGRFEGRTCHATVKLVKSTPFAHLW